MLDFQHKLKGLNTFFHVHLLTYFLKPNWKFPATGMNLLKDVEVLLTAFC